MRRASGASGAVSTTSSTVPLRRTSCSRTAGAARTRRCPGKAAARARRAGTAVRKSPRPRARSTTSSGRRSAGGTAEDLLGEAARRPSAEVGQHDGLAAPAGEEGGLGQVGDRVVPPLGEDVGAEAVEDGQRRVLVEL